VKDTSSNVFLCSSIVMQYCWLTDFCDGCLFTTNMSTLFVIFATLTVVICKPLKGVGSTSPFEKCDELERLNVSWYYNWNPTTNCTTNAQFIPMIWSDFFIDQISIVNNTAPVLLTFNEPDFELQANMSVSLAVSLWPKIEQVDRRMKISSPAPTASPAGQQWLHEFMQACCKCRVDIIALHYYNKCDINSFFTFINSWARYGLPIWLTEFDCMYGSEEDNIQFAKQVIPLIPQRAPLLERFAWFATRTEPQDLYYHGCGLFNATTGSISPLGQVYSYL
jgi:hypothetical protein